LRMRIGRDGPTDLGDGALGGGTAQCEEDLRYVPEPAAICGVAIDLPCFFGPRST
jgi:hypothetical protein